MHLLAILIMIIGLSLAGHAKKEWLGILMYPVKLCLFIAGGVLLVIGAWACVFMCNVLWTVL